MGKRSSILRRDRANATPPKEEEPSWKTVSPQDVGTVLVPSFEGMEATITTMGSGETSSCIMSPSGSSEGGRSHDLALKKEAKDSKQAHEETLAEDNNNNNGALPWWYPYHASDIGSVGWYCLVCWGSHLRDDDNTNSNNNGAARRNLGPPVFHGNGPALGWGLDAVGRSVAFIASGAFLGTALLRLAKEHVGCETDPPPGSDRIPECTARLFGILRPSSLLTTYTLLVGLLSSTLMPVMGAIVDYTPHRLLFGQVTTVLILLLMIPSLWIGENTWIALALVQMAVAFFGWAQTMVTFAYMPELTQSAKLLHDYNQTFTIMQFLSMILFLGAVVGAAGAFGLGDLDTAKLGQGTAFVISLATLYPAWFILLEPRPAAHPLPPRLSLWTAGFHQVYTTCGYIYHNLPSLMWFYVSTAFCDAAINSLATVFLTFMTDTLAFTTQESGLAILAMLFGSLPGAVFAGWTTHASNPVVSCGAAMMVLLVVTLVAVLVLTGPNQQMESYGFAFGWGIGTGWKWTSDRVVASFLMPKGQDAELMGTYLFAGQILTWLPPLVFTLWNEVGSSSDSNGSVRRQRWGLGSLCFWFALSLLALAKIGSYRKAVEAAGKLDRLDHGKEFNKKTKSAELAEETEDTNEPQEAA